jgi:UDP:flavonoid glycosyltransferase YjiC (YdhE family)
MRFLFGICSWGLGHASRSLPIIRKVIKEGHMVTVVSSGRALNMLQQELGDEATFVNLADYNPPETLNPSFFVPSTILHFPVYLRSMFREHDFVRRFIWSRHVDAIFSDNRFAFYSRDIPSYFMSHQLRILNPLRNVALENGTEFYNQYFLKRYAGVLVPDFREDGLSGRLAHNLSRIDEKHVNYVGVISEFSYYQTPQDIDVFLSISGPEPHRTYFEHKVRKQLEGFGGNVVVTLGKPEASVQEGPNLSSYLRRVERENILNRSRLVVARSGYSTLMDLFALRKKGFLVPTPGQSEQEYLAKFHMDRGTFYCVSEKELDLPNQLEKALAFHPPRMKYSSERAIQNAMDVIMQTAKVEQAQIISAR